MRRHPWESSRASSTLRDGRRRTLRVPLVGCRGLWAGLHDSAPVWSTDEDEADYETTEKGQPFKGTVVYRRSVGDPIVKIIVEPSR